jgi:hypothetical protein
MMAITAPPPISVSPIAGSRAALTAYYSLMAIAILNALSGPDSAFLDGPAPLSGMLVLMHRAISIAGGTPEIKRNQIGERILGLPRGPLVG